jgi:hypothetical protein
MVLTKNTLQITAAEKYVANAMIPAYYRLFAPVNANTADVITQATAAITRISVQTVCMAHTRA